MDITNKGMLNQISVIYHLMISTRSKFLDGVIGKTLIFIVIDMRLVKSVVLICLECHERKK